MCLHRTHSSSTLSLPTQRFENARLPSGRFHSQDTIPVKTSEMLKPIVPRPVPLTAEPHPSKQLAIDARLLVDKLRNWQDHSVNHVVCGPFCGPFLSRMRANER